MTKLVSLVDVVLLLVVVAPNRLESGATTSGKAEIETREVNITEFPTIILFDGHIPNGETSLNLLYFKFLYQTIWLKKRFH